MNPTGSRVSKLKKVARQYHRHPAGAPNSQGGQFAPKNKAMPSMPNDGVSRLKTIASQSASVKATRQAGSPNIHLDVVKIKSFRKAGEGVEGQVFIDDDAKVVYKVPKNWRGDGKQRIQMGNAAITRGALSSTGNPTFMEDQVQLAKRISDLGIGPKIYNYDKNTGIVAMGLVEGDQLSEKPPKTKKAKVKAMIDIVDQLRTLHDNNIAHGDLHSGNIMVTDKGKATVIDFGMAESLQKQTNAVAVQRKLLEVKHLIADFTEEDLLADGLRSDQEDDLNRLRKKINKMCIASITSRSINDNDVNDTYAEIYSILKRK
jgi:tRNA A-37 threonylcarbamoyl transferase component Bud32